MGEKASRKGLPAPQASRESPWQRIRRAASPPGVADDMLERERRADSWTDVTTSIDLARRHD